MMMETVVETPSDVVGVYGGGGGGGGGGGSLRTSFRSHSAPSTPMEDQVSHHRRSISSNRRVSFPIDEVVTCIVEPPNPWEKAVEVSAMEVVAAYVAACDRYDVTPLSKVVQQLEKAENFEDRIESLDLQGNKLDFGQIEALEEIFKRTQFHTINVENTSLDDEGATALFDMIEYYESAEHLIISRNKNFTLRGWQGFCRMIKRTHCLGELELAGISLGDNINILARTLKVCSNLATLHLENCNLSGKYLAILMSYLMTNNSLRELYIGQNRLSFTDAVQVGNFLRSNSKLKLLHLGNNQLEDKGMGQIAEGLSDQSAGVCHGGLSTLVVHNNHLSNKSTEHIAQMLADCKSLTSLDVGQNNFNNEGVHCLKEALVKNRTLASLSLKGCRITCEGAVALAEYIADNSSIQALDLRENNIKLGGLMALTHSMKVNPSVRKLELDGVSLKEQLQDPDKQHQSLLFEIMEYCDRNDVDYEKRRIEEEKLQKEQNTEEVLSEPINRLLSLWSNQPPVQRTPMRTVSNPPPITISSIAETPTENYGETSTWQMIRGTSHCLRSPQPSPTSSPIPSPTRNRFRVTRVFQDADAQSKKGCNDCYGVSSTTKYNSKTIVNSQPPPPPIAPATSNGRIGRFKFTVTPVKNINAVETSLPPVCAPQPPTRHSNFKVLQRKSDSDLLSSLSSNTSPSGTVDSGYDSTDLGPELDGSLELSRLSDQQTKEEESACVYYSNSEEEGEDSVFLDVPAVAPNSRVRHDSMRVHKRRLSNGEDLLRLPLESLQSLQDIANYDSDEVKPSSETLSDCEDGLNDLPVQSRERSSNNFVVQRLESLDSVDYQSSSALSNAMDSLDIINFEKHDLENGFHGILDDIIDQPVYDLSDSESNEQLELKSITANDFDDKSDVAVSGGASGDQGDLSGSADRDSGIYVFDASTEDLRTPHSDQSETECTPTTDVQECSSSSEILNVGDSVNGSEDVNNEECSNNELQLAIENDTECPLEEKVGRYLQSNCVESVEGANNDEKQNPVIVVDDEDVTTPINVCFSLVDIGDYDEMGETTMVKPSNEYSGSWLVKTTDGKVKSVKPEAEFFRCSSASSLDLLTGDDYEEEEVDNWLPSSAECLQDSYESSGDLMLFVDKSTEDRTIVSSDSATLDLDTNLLPNSSEEMDGKDCSGQSSANDLVAEMCLDCLNGCSTELVEGQGTTDDDELTEVVSAWIKCYTSEWSARDKGCTNPSPCSSQLPKTMDTLSHRIAQNGSESSNSSDSGVPESPMSCSPPIGPNRTSQAKRKLSNTLTAGTVGLGMEEVLERLEIKNSVPISPGHVVQSRGFMDVAAEFLIPREALSGSSDSRRETTTGCPGLQKMSCSVGNCSVAKEVTT